jgi:hypothetical protein
MHHQRRPNKIHVIWIRSKLHGPDWSKLHKCDITIFFSSKFYKQIRLVVNDRCSQVHNIKHGIQFKKIMYSLEQNTWISLPTQLLIYTLS